jgi:hypothetical protein
MSEEQLRKTIRHLNAMKRKADDLEIIKDANKLQRKLEEKAGVTAVELDPIYND